MNTPIIGKKLFITMAIMLLVMLFTSFVAQAQDVRWDLYPTYHNTTQKEVANVVWGLSPMGKEVTDAIDQFSVGNYKAYDYRINGDTLTYVSKVDGGLKLIAILKKVIIVKEIKTSTLILKASRPDSTFTVQTITLVNDSLELNEVKMSNMVVAISNPRLVPEKELTNRLKEVNSQIYHANSQYSKGYKLSQYGFLERHIYDWIHSMCDKGFLNTERPTVYFVTPIGLIDQAINNPVKGVGKIKMKIAERRIKRLKRLRNDLLLAQKYYDEQRLVNQ